MGQALTGALAIIKVGGNAIGFMKNFHVSDQIRRVEIRGLGTILPQESDVVEWAGTVTCDFYEIDYKISGIPGAIERAVGPGNTASKIASGNNTPNFEDNLVLDATGVQIALYKKVEDYIDPKTGLINPAAVSYANLTRCFPTGENITIDEGQVSGRGQSFVFLDPIVY